MQEGLGLGSVAGPQDVLDVLAEDAEVGWGGCGRRVGEQVEQAASARWMSVRSRVAPEASSE